MFKNKLSEAVTSRGLLNPSTIALTFVEAADDLPGELSSEGNQMQKFENEHFKQPQLTFKHELGAKT